VNLIGIGVSRLLIPCKLLISQEPKLQDFPRCRVGRTIFVQKYFEKPGMLVRVGIHPVPPQLWRHMDFAQPTP
jgi:hypothetical protein